MANRAEHIKSSGTAAAVYTGIDEFFDQDKRIRTGQQRSLDFGQLLFEIGKGYLGGMLGGIAPDVIEPATDPNHRKFFHSLVGGTAITATCFKAEGRNLTKGQRRFLRSIGVGYATHLYVDSKTPKGIDFI